MLKTVPLGTRASSADDLARAVRASRRPVLVVLRGNDVGKSKRLEQTSVVGRDPDADFALTDAQVSWHHSRVEDRGDSWAVLDLGSTNGTFVNSRRVDECVLAPNDKITVGRTVLRFEVQDALDQAYGDVVERMLNYDDLSGLFVRRKFDAELQQMLAAAHAHASCVGLLVMDLDGIKAINDTHGHLFGAYVIGESGRVIGRVLGAAGMGARFGGDEFLAAIPGADLPQAVAIAEQVHAAIAAHHFERDGVLLRPGISIGVASFPESAKDAKALFEHADGALYRAKQAGKNRVCT